MFMLGVSMFTKTTLRRYFWFILLVLTLAACTPDIPVPTATLIPTATTTPIPPTPTSTIKATSTFAPATPMPTLVPPPIFTPDAIQVERWQEYQTELAKDLLRGYGPDAYKDALCEWDILGRSGQEVYVWAYCAIREGAGGSRPAVIYLEADGTIRNVRVAGYKGPYFDLDLFPAEVQEKRGLYTGYSRFNGRIREMVNHIDYREIHPEEPPLVVLSAMPTATPTP